MPLRGALPLCRSALPAASPELAVVHAGSVSVHAMDGALAFGPVAVPGGVGGNPTVADYDGDGLPELGVAGMDFYTVFDIDWTTALGGAALAGLVSLLQIWAEGGQMLADDERVTGTYVGKRRAT